MTDTEKSTRPFTMEHVLKLTSKNVRRHIDVSIRKTFERVEEFKNDPKKSREVFDTLSILHTMRKELDDFQIKYSEAFRKSKEEQSSNTSGEEENVES